MKSKLLMHLHRCNKKLQQEADSCFRNFLLTLFGTLPRTEATDRLERFTTSGDWTSLVLEADSLASTVYVTAAEHMLWNQVAALVRKYPFTPGQVKFDQEGEALRKFRHSEHVCSRVNERFRLFDVLRSPHESALKRAREWIQYVLGDLFTGHMLAQGNYGPGASIGVTGNATNSARKILAKSWSVTPGAFYFARSALTHDRHIMELLCSPEPPVYGEGLNYDAYKKAFELKAKVVDCNKITFVPKTAKIHRTIAVEPLLNGYVQKGIDLYMRFCLKRVGIDLSDQSRNQELAFLGSLHDDDPYVTIDLSSASDSVSIGLCRNLLPPDWFRFMDSVRSRQYLLKGEKFTFHKFVTMGNGFCFPLETLIFASLCHTAHAENGTKADFSVYGDDIIVRQSVASRVLELLKVCGFSVNASKTFLSGPFRESCGADWFEGEDVRPLSLDYRFESIRSIIKFCNLARSKGAWEGILHPALEYLESRIPRELMFARPFSGQVDTALEVPLDVFMSSPFAKFDRNVQAWSWMEYVDVAWCDVPITRVAGYNVALMRGALTGCSSETPFAERRKTRTKVRRMAHSGAASNWLPGI